MTSVSSVVVIVMVLSGMSSLVSGEKLYAFRGRMGRTSFHSAVEGEGEREFRPDGDIIKGGRPVELHVRIVALGRREGRGFGLVAFHPIERYGVAQGSVERKIAPRGDDSQGLLDFAAFWRTDVHERIDLRQNARVTHVRPAELLHVRLQLLERLYADAQFVAGRELVIFADRSCEFGMDPEPIVERNGFAVQSKVLDAFDESVKRTLHVLELATDESVVQCELNHLIKVVGFAFRDLGTLAGPARLRVVPVDDTIFQLRLNISHSFIPLFIVSLNPPAGCHSASYITGKVVHWTIAETAKCVTRNLRKVFIPSGEAKGNGRLRATCAVSRWYDRRAYGSYKPCARRPAGGNPLPRREQCLSQHHSGLKLRGGILEAKRHSTLAQVPHSGVSRRHLCRYRKEGRFPFHSRFRRKGNHRDILLRHKTESVFWRVPDGNHRLPLPFPSLWLVHQACSRDYLYRYLSFSSFSVILSELVFNLLDFSEELLVAASAENRQGLPNGSIKAFAAGLGEHWTFAKMAKSVTTALSREGRQKTLIGHKKTLRRVLGNGAQGLGQRARRVCAVRCGRMLTTEHTECTEGFKPRNARKFNSLLGTSCKTFQCVPCIPWSEFRFSRIGQTRRSNYGEENQSRNHRLRVCGRSPQDLDRREQFGELRMFRE